MSRLIEIIPSIGTPVIWGQYPMFSHPKSSQGALLGVGEGGCSGWWLHGGILFLSWVPPRAHGQGSYDLMAWWLQHPLFTGMAGNILSLTGVSHHHLCLAETQRQAEERESFTVERKGEGEASGMPWLEAVGLEKVEAGRPAVGLPLWLVKGPYLALFGWS